MTNRRTAYTVTLSQDMCQGDVEAVIAALKMIKGVHSVEPVEVSQAAKPEPCTEVQPLGPVKGPDIPADLLLRLNRFLNPRRVLGSGAACLDEAEPEPEFRLAAFDRDPEAERIRRRDEEARAFIANRMRDRRVNALGQIYKRDYPTGQWVPATGYNNRPLFHTDHHNRVVPPETPEARWGLPDIPRLPWEQNRGPLGEPLTQPTSYFPQLGI
jgi:hypothetical protein